MDMSGRNGERRTFAQYFASQLQHGCGIAMSGCCDCEQGPPAQNYTRPAPWALASSLVAQLVVLLIVDHGHPI
jgi:hypothetical protein